MLGDEGAWAVAYLAAVGGGVAPGSELHTSGSLRLHLQLHQAKVVPWQIPSTQIICGGG